MIDSSKKLLFPALAALALAAAGCPVSADGQIPCVEDVSCPNDYPVCAAGKCTAGTSTGKTSVAIVGAEGHAASDFLSGAVRVIVSARAATGVASVKLASGSVNLVAATPALTPPLYVFNVDTTALADGDAPLTATLTAGDGSTGTASGTLHVDNAKPVITVFTVAGSTSTTITAGKTAPLSASFSGGTATVTASSGGSVGLASGASVLVSPDVATTYNLRVTSRSGVTVQTGSTGQPPDITVSVVSPASFTGTASVSPATIQQGPGGGSKFTFTAPALAASVVSAVVKDGADATVGTINLGTGIALVDIPDTAPGTTQLTYKLVISNGATTPDTISFALVVKVGSPPTIASFTTPGTITSGASASLQATFAGGNGVINPGNIPIVSGGTVIVAPATTTSYTLTVTNATTSASVSSGTTGQPANVTITVVPPPLVNTFTTSTVHASSGANVTFATTTTGVSGNASVTGICSPSGTVTPFTIVLTGGNGSSIRTVPTVTAQTVCTYTAAVQNAATTTVQATVVVTVEPLPVITNFKFQSSGTLAATFALGDDVVLAHAYNAQGGTATINGVTAGATTTTFTNLRFNTAYTLTVTNLAGTVLTQTANATVAPGTWSALNTNTFTVRGGATVTALSSGKVLIAGGTNLTGDPLATAEICDATGSCITKTMGSARSFHTAVVIGTGASEKVLLAGGYVTKGPPATLTNSAEFFTTSTETFASTTAITTGSVTANRARHVAVVLLDSSGVPTTTVLIAGGTDGTTNLRSAIRYNAGASPPTTADVTNTSGNAMAQARASFTGTALRAATALIPEGKVLIVGGKAGDLTAELFDPAGGACTCGAFSSTGALGEDKRSHTAVFINGASPNFGKVLISGGVTGPNAGTPSSTQFLYSAGTFTPVAALATPRSNHAAISLPTDSILICGGTSDGSNTLNSCERYDPASGTGNQFPTAPMLEARKDFGLAPITISSIVEILAAGSPVSPMNYAETYNTN